MTVPATTTPAGYLTTRAVADSLGVSTETVRRRCLKAGIVPLLNPLDQRVYLLRVSDVEKLTEPVPAPRRRRRRSAAEGMSM